MGESSDFPHVTPHISAATASTARHDHTERSPEEIRREIEQTRARLGETAAELQDRLSPAHLKEQAMHTVRETRDHAMHAVRENTIGRAEHMVRDAANATRGWFSNLIHMVVDNPVPAALTGIGIGWLLVENAARSNEREVYYTSYQPLGYQPTGHVSTSYRSSGYETTGYQPGYESTGYRRGYESTGYRPGYETSGSTAYRQGYETTGSTGSTGYQTAGYSPGYESRTYAQTGTGSTHAYTGSETARSTGGEWTGNEGEDQGPGVGERVKEVLADGRERVRDLVEEGRERVRDVYEGSREHLQHLGYQTRYGVRRAGTAFSRTLEENPLVIGTAALGLATMIGLSLPHTRREDELLGPYRDQLVDKAQQGAVQALDMGKQVAREKLSEAESKAHSVVNQATSTKVESTIVQVQTTAPAVPSGVQSTAHDAVSWAKDAAARKLEQGAEAAKRAVDNTGDSLKDSGKPRV